MADDRAQSETENLNANHKRVLVATFAQLDHAFGQIDAAMADTSSPLAAHVDDLASERTALVRDQLERIREHLASAVRVLDLRVPERIPITRALHVALTHAQVALDELAPQRLRGYGLLGAEAAERVATVLSDLDRMIRRLATDLARPEVADLAGRITHVRGDDHRDRLARIERVVTRHGLVELRPTIAGILELLEAGTFEVALFGRVSCGKSSLINTVLGLTALPVGATPVTAVPTRVQRGAEAARVIVRLADGSTKVGPVSLLQELVTEAGNGGNRHRVTYATVELPAANLLGRLALVDTPGVGSLATQGTRETLGYLPRCDLGVLLVDASSALGREEIDLLRRLVESGIEAQVVLSKGDLVAVDDRERVRVYFAHEIERALGRALQVDMVSSTEANLAGAWFSDRIAPLVSRSNEMIAESATRKLAALQATVIGILRSAAEHVSRPVPGTGDEIERLALATEGHLRTASEHATMLTSGLGEATQRVIGTATHRAHATGANVGGAVVASLREEVDRARQLLEADLTATRAKLRDLLLELSHVARIGLDVPELRLDLISQPAFAPSAAIVPNIVSMPHWPAAERRLATRIESAVGEPIRAALSDYAKNLLSWADAVLSQFSTQVTAYTEPCRALVRDAAATPADVNEDLRTLERL